MKKIAILLGVIVLFSALAGCINQNSKDSDNDNKASLPDTDSDGISDQEDFFPTDPAASIDSDNDGYPDRWNPGKDASDSTSDPPLEIDEFPYNPDEWVDSDNDMVGDNEDVFPNDPNEWSDMDLDGVGDNSDINPSVNLSISFKLNKFKLTDFVDIVFWAQVYFDIKINEKIYRFDNSKNNFKVWLYQQKNVDISIFLDIPDDTNQAYSTIEIIMYDYDFFGQDDIIDIDESPDLTNHIVVIDHVNNKVSTEGISRGSQASIWYDIILADPVVPDTDTFDITYKWNFKNNYFEMPVKISKKTYLNSLNSEINRIPQDEIFSIKNAMKAFVTPDEKVIDDISQKLEVFSQEKNYNSLTKANFVLRFVQKIVDYEDDEITKGCLEYWRLPIETLVEQKGDCEDSSTLYASIMKNMGYDVALLYYVWDEGDEKLGHIAVGVNLDGDHGEYVQDNTGNKYYYCETTTLTYYLGEIPNEIKGDVELIIKV